jgi:hypothetical protein
MSRVTASPLVDEGPVPVAAVVVTVAGLLTGVLLVARGVWRWVR